MLFYTQSSARLGSPSVAGSRSCLRAGTRAGSWATAALRPAPRRRTVPLGRATSSSSSSPRLIPDQVWDLTDQSGLSRDDRKAAPSGRPHFGGSEHAMCTFVQLRADRIPATADGSLIDHVIRATPVRSTQASHSSRVKRSHAHGVRFSYCLLRSWMLIQVRACCCLD